MKAIIILSMLLFLNHSDYAQTQKTATPKVTKEEKKEDSKSKKYGDRTAYQITFSDGTTGKLWQAKDDSKWWGSNGMMDRGPYTKAAAIQWLYNYKHSDGSAGSAAAGAVVGASLMSGSGGSSSNQSTGKSSGTKRTSINLRKKK